MAKFKRVYHYEKQTYLNKLRLTDGELEYLKNLLIQQRGTILGDDILKAIDPPKIKAVAWPFPSVGNDNTYEV